MTTQGHVIWTLLSVFVSLVCVYSVNQDCQEMAACTEELRAMNETITYRIGTTEMINKCIQLTQNFPACYDTAKTACRLARRDTFPYQILYFNTKESCNKVCPIFEPLLNCEKSVAYVDLSTNKNSYCRSYRESMACLDSNVENITCSFGKETKSLILDTVYDQEARQFGDGVCMTAIDCLDIDQSVNVVTSCLRTWNQTRDYSDSGIDSLKDCISKTATCSDALNVVPFYEKSLNGIVETAPITTESIETTSIATTQKMMTSSIRSPAPSTDTSVTSSYTTQPDVGEFTTEIVTQALEPTERTEDTPMFPMVTNNLDDGVVMVTDGIGIEVKSDETTVFPSRRPFSRATSGKTQDDVTTTPIIETDTDLVQKMTTTTRKQFTSRSVKSYPFTVSTEPKFVDKQEYNPNTPLRVITTPESLSMDRKDGAQVNTSVTSSYTTQPDVGEFTSERVTQPLAPPNGTENTLSFAVPKDSNSDKKSIIGVTKISSTTSGNEGGVVMVTDGNRDGVVMVTDSHGDDVQEMMTTTTDSGRFTSRPFKTESFTLSLKTRFIDRQRHTTNQPLRVRTASLSMALDGKDVTSTAQAIGSTAEPITKPTTVGREITRTESSSLPSKTESATNTSFATSTLPSSSVTSLASTSLESEGTSPAQKKPLNNDTGGSSKLNYRGTLIWILAILSAYFLT